MWVAKDTAAGPRLGAWMGSHKGRLRGPHRDEAPQDGGPDFEARPSEVARLMSHLAFAVLGRGWHFVFPSAKGRGRGPGGGEGEGQVAVRGAILPSRGTGPPIPRTLYRPFLGRSDKGLKSGTLDSGPGKSRAPSSAWEGAGSMAQGPAVPWRLQRRAVAQGAQPGRLACGATGSGVSVDPGGRHVWAGLEEAAPKEARPGFCGHLATCPFPSEPELVRPGRAQGPGSLSGPRCGPARDHRGQRELCRPWRQRPRRAQ